MPTAIFYNVPARGHVNPTLPVVSRLVGAGDRVHYYASAGYRDAVRATGAEFHPYPGLPDDYFPAAGLTGAQPVRTATVLAQTAASLVPALVEEAGHLDADYVLTDSLCPWGWLVARATGRPLVVSSTFLVLSLPVVLSQPAMAHVLFSVVRGLGGLPRFRRTWRPLARRFGVPPLRLDQFFAVPGDLVVNYTAELFQPAAHRVPARTVFVGPSVEPRVGEPEFPFDWLDGRPLVYASLGTIDNDDPGFYRACIEAFADPSVQLVMSIGSRLDEAELGTVPGHVLVRRTVPQLALLARARLLITHAGMNSVQEALLNGVPPIAVPHQPEQVCVARQVVALGAGAMLSPAKFSASRLRDTADRVLADGRVRRNAARVGAALAAAGGADRAAHEIMSFVREARGERRVGR